jgi:hypothetical protein
VREGWSENGERITIGRENKRDTKEYERNEEKDKDTSVYMRLAADFPWTHQYIISYILIQCAK